jgi:hypothetical protein
MTLASFDVIGDGKRILCAFGCTAVVVDSDVRTIWNGFD